MQLNYKKVGEGTPLIILHGLFGSLDNWMGIAKTLGERFEVYLLDARNHGQSPHSDEFDYELMAEDLYEFIQVHQIVNPVVLGHSMGGKTAMQFAMNHPDILTKLIVADIAPKPYPVHHRQIIDGLIALDFNEINTRQQADEELSKYISDLSVRQFLLKNLYWKEKETLAWRFNLKAINQNIEIVGKPLNNILPFLQPTLFIRGEKSNYILESDFEEIKHIFPNSEVKTIANCGHWIHAEQPQEFMRLVIEFLDL